MKKVYLETFGCQMNVSDSERVATKLAADGFEIVSESVGADVVLLNTCSIREKAEHKLYTRIGQVRNPDGTKPLVGVLGCVAQLEGETLFRRSPNIDFVLGTRAIGRVGAAIEKVLGGAANFADLGDRENNFDLAVSDAQRHSPFVGFVPVIEGCNKFCTYCIVPFARGREKSLPAAEIIKQILILKARGVKEAHLIGQNVNSYRPPNDDGLTGFRGATPFSRLLRAVASTGIERIKFNTSFPRDFHTDIVNAIDEHENLCNWVHLPVQSGSNEILRAMRRGHTIENYLERVDKIKSSNRKISLTTDIIVGFPGETDENFEDTLRLARHCQFDGAYTFKYSPRPGTPAFELGDTVPEPEKNRRFQELDSVIRAGQQRVFQSYLNRTVKVLAERISPKDDNSITGHSTSHKVVNFRGSGELLGKILDVEILECKTNTLYGEIR